MNHLTTPASIRIRELSPSVIGLDACMGSKVRKAGAAHSPAGFVVQAQADNAVTRTRSWIHVHPSTYADSFARSPTMPMIAKTGAML